MINMRQLAALAGVSTWTVSNALRDNPKVHPATRQRIKELAARNHYSLYSHLPLPSTGFSSSIGVVFPFGEYPICVHTLNSIITEVGVQQYGIVIFPVESEAVRGQMLRHTLIASRVNGIILYTGRNEPVSSEIYFALRSHAIPVVCIDTTFFTMPIDRVNTDYAQTSALIADYLIGLGHRMIAIMQMRDEANDLARERALLAAFRRHRLLLLSDPRPHQPGVSIHFEEDGLKKLLSRRGTPLAIVGREDGSAAMMMREAQQLDVDIPGCVSIVGYGNLMMSTHLNPQLTTVDQHPDEIGRQAVQLLLRRIVEKRLDIPWEPETVYVPTTLLVRGSSGIPRRR